MNDEMSAAEFRKTIKKKSRYGIATKQYNGYTYHSAAEANYARDLDILKQSGELLDWDRQVKHSIYSKITHDGDVVIFFGHEMSASDIKKMRAKLICNYYIDFVLYWNDGSKEYVEVKGAVAPLWQLKWNLFDSIMKVEGHTTTIVRR